MANSGAGGHLSNTNEELVKMMGSITQQKEEIDNLINQEESEKRELEEQLKALQVKHEKLTSSLDKKKATRNEYDRTLEET